MYSQNISEHLVVYFVILSLGSIKNAFGCDDFKKDEDLSDDEPQLDDFEGSESEYCPSSGEAESSDDDQSATDSEDVSIYLRLLIQLACTRVFEHRGTWNECFNGFVEAGVLRCRLTEVDTNTRAL